MKILLQVTLINSSRTRNLLIVQEKHVSRPIALLKRVGEKPQHSLHCPSEQSIGRGLTFLSFFVVMKTSTCCISIAIGYKVENKFPILV